MQCNGVAHSTSSNKNNFYPFFFLMSIEMATTAATTNKLRLFSTKHNFQVKCCCFLLSVRSLVTANTLGRRRGGNLHRLRSRWQIEVRIALASAIATAATGISHTMACSTSHGMRSMNCFECCSIISRFCTREMCKKKGSRRLTRRADI